MVTIALTPVSIAGPIAAFAASAESTFLMSSRIRDESKSPALEPSRRPSDSPSMKSLPFILTIGPTTRTRETSCAHKGRVAVTSTTAAIIATEAAPVLSDIGILLPQLPHPQTTRAAARVILEVREGSGHVCRERRRRFRMSYQDVTGNEN